jgi:hypothetical protein
MWDVQKAVQHLNERAEASSKGYCARYVKAAISAGGGISSWPSIVSAKDYGPALIERGFNVIAVTGSFMAGDVVIIQGFKKADFPAGEIKKDHPHGHMAMFNGQQWVSDFRQNNGYYPGGDYRKAKPTFVFYRHKDVDAQSSGKSTVADNKAMKTCFPARKKNGENYATLDEIMDLIGREPHGTWLAGTNKMWHGGIHLTEISAPGSVLKPDAMDSVVPVQCMADGEVVAWRLNQDYKTDTYNSQKLQYSTTFVLVKSVCKPDPEKENSWLEFYSLYMGLAPLSAFEKRKCMVAKKTVSKRKAGKYESSQQAGSVPHAPRATGLLAQGRRVLILEEATFLNKPVSPQARPGTTEAQPFGLAQEFDKDGKLKSEKFWVTLLPDYMAADGEQYAHLPVWMQKAVEKGTYDAVVKPATVLKISAGDAIGFLGEDIVPVGMGQISSSAYAHIEVLCADSRMSSFLDNPGRVISGRKFIRVHPSAMLYTLSGDTFIKTTTPVKKDMHIILPVDKCKPKESGGKNYYQAGESYWLSQDDVDLIDQYNLKDLGFTALAEESTPDMSASLKEGWMKSGYKWLTEQLRPERGIQEQQMSAFYKGMIDRMDTDKDGQLSERELFAALHHPEMGVRDIVSRMIVKHESEWFGGSSHQKWSAFFQDYDILRVGFAKKWLDDMEWMSQVEPFTSGQAVWHMHPVVFLDALGNPKGLINVDAFISLYEREHTSFASGTAALSTASKSNLRKLLMSINDFYSSSVEYKPNLYKLAYMLATTRHETYHYTTAEFFSEKPEIGGVSYFNKYDPVLADTQKRKDRAVRNGNTLQGDGFKYRGRGCVHLTWKNNYQKAQNKFGVNFVSVPDLAGDFKYAVPIMVWGMEEGIFSGKSLKSYISNGGINYIGARYVINGQDQAPLIASYAKRFESILEKTSTVPKEF